MSQEINKRSFIGMLLLAFVLGLAMMSAFKKSGQTRADSSQSGNGESRHQPRSNIEARRAVTTFFTSARKIASESAKGGNRRHLDFLERLEKSEGAVLKDLFRLVADDQELASSIKEYQLGLVTAKITQELGLKGALAFVGERLSTGAIKESVLYYAFLAASESPDRMMDLLRENCSKNETIKALAGIAANLGESGSLDKCDFTKLAQLNLTPRDMDILVNNMLYAIPLGDAQRSASDKFLTASDFFRGLSKVIPGGDKLYGQFLLHSATVAPFEAWNELRSLPDGILDERSRQEIATAMACSNPSKASEELRSGPTASILLPISFREWLRQDSGAATKWYNLNSNTMAPLLNDKLSEELTAASGNRGNFQQAEKLVEKIQDDSVRADAQERLNRAYEKRIKDNIETNPTAEIQRLLDTGSSEQNLIGFGFEQYIKKDSSAAYDWYQSNKSRLSGNQLDCVSKAYFKAAIQMSDFATAKLWADQINDRALRQQLIDQILNEGKNSRGP